MPFECTFGYYEHIETEYSVNVLFFRNFLEINLFAISSNSEWDFDLDCLDEHKTIYCLRDLSDLDLDDFYKDNQSQNDYYNLKEKIKIYIETNQLEKSKDLEDQITFWENIPEPVATDLREHSYYDTSNYDYKAVCNQEFRHPVTRKEKTLQKFGISRPNFSRKGKVKSRTFTENII